MKLIFNPCGEFRFRGPSQSNPLSSPPRWWPWDLFRSFKVCSDAKEIVGCGKQREATAPIQSVVKLQPWFPSLCGRPAFGRTAAQVPALAVKYLPLGRTLMMMILLLFALFMSPSFENQPDFYFIQISNNISYAFYIFRI